MFLAAMTTAVALSDKQTLDVLRFWNAGSVQGVGWDVIGVAAIFVAVGVVPALLTLPTINLLNLGDDVARSLGVNIAAGRTVGVVAVMLLAGAATAACGPISDLIARTVLPNDLPVGVVTAMIGGPFLVHLLVRANLKTSDLSIAVLGLAPQLCTHAYR